MGLSLLVEYLLLFWIESRNMEVDWSQMRRIFEWRI